ncbi:hypothetical protein OG21DRAFT_1525772 [Imleria badia]|nr:hypothetical protein OG21DRAFT_1525772 [Imleria badia]
MLAKPEIKVSDKGHVNTDVTLHFTKDKGDPDHVALFLENVDDDLEYIVAVNVTVASDVTVKIPSMIVVGGYQHHSIGNVNSSQPRSATLKKNTVVATISISPWVDGKTLGIVPSRGF